MWNQEDFFCEKKNIEKKKTSFHLWHTSTCMCVPNQNPRPPSLLRNIENCTHHGWGGNSKSETFFFHWLRRRPIPSPLFSRLLDDDGKIWIVVGGGIIGGIMSTKIKNKSLDDADENPSKVFDTMRKGRRLLMLPWLANLHLNRRFTSEAFWRWVGCHIR